MAVPWSVWDRERRELVPSAPRNMGHSQSFCLEQPCCEGASNTPEQANRPLSLNLQGIGVEVALDTGGAGIVPRSLALDRGSRGLVDTQKSSMVTQ